MMANIKVGGFTEKGTKEQGNKAQVLQRERERLEGIISKEYEHIKNL